MGPVAAGAGRDWRPATGPEPLDLVSCALTPETTAWRTGGRTGGSVGGPGGACCSEWPSGTPSDPVGSENNKVRSWSWRSHRESLEAGSNKSETSSNEEGRLPEPVLWLLGGGRVKSVWRFGSLAGF